jgi:hypothetical protein
VGLHSSGREDAVAGEDLDDARVAAEVVEEDAPLVSVAGEAARHT